MVGLLGLGSGVASHLLGGGLLPGAAPMALLAGVSIVAGALLLNAWASTTRLVLLVVAAQTGWHLVLSGLAGHAGDPGAPAAATPVPEVTGGGRTGSLFDAYAASLPEASGAADGGGAGFLSHQLDHLAHQGPLMVLAHLLGAVALGLFLARGEHALCTLLILSLARLLRVVRPCRALHVTPLTSTGPHPGAVVVAPRSVHVVRHVPRRGPPRALPRPPAVALAA
ncbi:MAG: hypothetical protein ACI379_11685 [Nocardioides sp.]|uniref:hypothetical protein n=1 Tax=Nocardioides sp. TaxID=35761 RepID=UPI003F083555